MVLKNAAILRALQKHMTNQLTAMPYNRRTNGVVEYPLPGRRCGYQLGPKVEKINRAWLPPRPVLRINRIGDNKRCEANRSFRSHSPDLPRLVPRIRRWGDITYC